MLTRERERAGKFQISFSWLFRACQDTLIICMNKCWAHGVIDWACCAVVISCGREVRDVVS